MSDAPDPSLSQTGTKDKETSLQCGEQTPVLRTLVAWVPGRSNGPSDKKIAADPWSLGCVAPSMPHMGYLENLHGANASSELI
jgi:hypothetical protein